MPVFDWESALATGVGGAGVGSAFGPVGTAIGGAAGFLGGGLLGGTKSSGGFTPSTFTADPDAANIGGTKSVGIYKTVDDLTDEELWHFASTGAMGPEIQAQAQAAEQAALEQAIADWEAQQQTAPAPQITPEEAALLRKRGMVPESLIRRMEGSVVDAEAPLFVRDEQGVPRDEFGQTPWDSLDLDQAIQGIRDVGYMDPILTQTVDAPVADIRAMELQAMSDAMLSGRSGRIAEYDPTRVNRASDAAEHYLSHDYSVPLQGLGAVAGLGGYGMDIGYLDRVIAGQEPSIAQLERERALESTQRQALSMAASSRQPGAWRTAIDAGAAAANEASRDAAILRAQEIDAALGRRMEARAGQAGAYRDLGSLTGERVGQQISYLDSARGAEADRFGAALDEWTARSGTALALEDQARAYRTDQAANEVALQGINAGVQNAGTAASASTYGTDVAANEARANRLINTASTGAAVLADNLGNKKKNPAQYTGPSGSGFDALGRPK